MTTDALLERFEILRETAIDLRGRINGATFADERGWLSREEFDQWQENEQRYPRLLAELGALVEQLRTHHTEAFDAWVQGRIDTLNQRIAARQRGDPEPWRVSELQFLHANWEAVLRNEKDDAVLGRLPRP